jgi:hypothetical protein
MSGRIRSLKPEWLEDELLNESSSDARVLSIGLILLADDHGNGRGSEKFLGAQIFSGQPLEVVSAALARLVEIRYCRIYVVDGQSYYSIRNWAKHQRVDKPGKPKVPSPSENFRETPENLSETPRKENKSLAPRARPNPLPSLPFPSRPEGVQGEGRPRDPMGDGLRGNAPRQRKDVQEVHAHWAKVTGRVGAKLGLGADDVHARIIAEAIDLYGEQGCHRILDVASDDGMVNGTEDKGKEHKDIGYIFGNPSTFARLLGVANRRAAGQTRLPASEAVRLHKLLEADDGAPVGVESESA